MSKKKVKKAKATTVIGKLPREIKGHFESPGMLWEADDEAPTCSYCGKSASKDEPGAGDVTLYETPISGTIVCEEQECRNSFCDDALELIQWVEDEDKEEKD